MPIEFTTQQVADAARITYRRVDYYVRIGWVRANEPTPGSGYPRTFDQAAAVQVAVIAALVRANIRPSAAAAIAASGSTQFETEDVQVEVDMDSIRTKTLAALLAYSDPSTTKETT